MNARLQQAPVWLVAFAHVHAMQALSSRLARSGAHGLIAVAAAICAYLAVMLATIVCFSPHGGHAAAIYAGAMAAATLAGTTLAGSLLPQALRTAGTTACIALALAYPAYVACTSAPSAPVQAMQGLYLAATALGGYVALILAPASGRIFLRHRTITI